MYITTSTSITPSITVIKLQEESDFKILGQNVVGAEYLMEDGLVEAQIGLQILQNEQKSQNIKLQKESGFKL